MTAVDDLILISVDDHVIEPPDLFAGHLTGDYLERAPKLVRNEAGNDVWTFGDAVIENPAADLLELESGALVPVVFVVEHDAARIVIDPPDGLFDLDADRDDDEPHLGEGSA